MRTLILFATGSFLVHLPRTVVAGDMHAQLVVRYGCNTATISVQHAVKPSHTYEYAWSTGMRGGSTITVRRGETSQVCAAVYCSCNGMAKAKADVCVDLTWPTEEAFQVETRPATCGRSDGQAMLTNASVINSIRWSTPSAPSTPDISGLRAGQYAVDVVDVHGCDHHIDFVIGGPEQMDLSGITAEPGPIDCHGGGGLVDFTVTTSEPIVISLDGFEATSFTGLTLGDHSFTVRRADNSACGAMVVTVPEPPSPEVGVEAVPPSCVPGGDGQVRLITDGTVEWKNPVGRTGAALDGLVAGTYSAWVVTTDGKSCGEVRAIVPEAERPQILTAATPTTCSYTTDGSVVLAATSAWPPIELETVNHTYDKLNSGQEIREEGLAPGTYTVSVLDSAGCPATATFNIPAPPPLWIHLEKENCRCAGDSSASLAATGGGGTPGYNWRWNKGTSTLAEEPLLANITIGVYTVELSDRNSCLALRSDTITEPPPMKHSKRHATRTRLWFATTVEVHGGIAPYQISIVRTKDGEETEEETERRRFLGTKRLRLMVRDSLGCEHRATLDTKRGRVRAALPNVRPGKDRVKACPTRWLFGIIPIRPKYCRD